MKLHDALLAVMLTSISLMTLTIVFASWTGDRESWLLAEWFLFATLGSVPSYITVAVFHLIRHLRRRIGLPM